MGVGRGRGGEGEGKRKGRRHGMYDNEKHGWDI